nr:CHAP domain-containing protein [Oceanirhabdus seepicola]
MQHFLYNTKFDIYENDAKRLKNLFHEFNLNNLSVYDFNFEKKNGFTAKGINKRQALAKIAETLAKREIVGEEYDEDYNKIVKYWPEVNCHEELKYSWCAAFIYHCCFEAGFKLPIRHPNSDRYVGVLGWFQWASLPEVGFYIEDSEDFVPERGDIIVYNNIIPKEYKQANDILPRDHIGIVLSSDKGTYTVAEGNVDNQNKAGVVTRKLHENVDGFIRICNDYEYMGWKYDYKTGVYKE